VHTVEVSLGNNYDDMNKKGTKNLIIVITYAVVLVLVVVNFKFIIHGTGKFIRLFNPLFIGIIFAFVLNKPCSWFESLIENNISAVKRKSTARGIAIGLTYIIIILIISMIIRFIIPQLTTNIQKFAGNINIYLNNLQAVLDKLTGDFGIERINISTLGIWIQENVTKIGTGIDDIVAQIIDITTGVISFLIQLVIGIVFSIYFMAGKEKLGAQGRHLLKTYLPEKIFNILSYLFNITKDVFNRYILGQFTEACILGILCFAGMLIFRFDYALLISILILITAFIPVVGAFIGGGVAFLLLLMVSPKEAFLFMIFLIILQQFEGNVIYPRTVGNKLGLPAIWVLLSITVGGGLFGPLGVLFGVPVATIIYLLIKNDIQKRDNRKS
jgi:predicted PurR-regulated permease PerM